MIRGAASNPTSLVFEPYAAEISHDPVNPLVPDGTVYASGENHRLQDTGPVAPRGIVLKPDHTPTGTKPQRKFEDEIIYEVHLRGFTRADQSIPESDRGTYRGAAQKATYLKELGVTAVEFLPVQETANDPNDMQPRTQGDNYWGYVTLAYFAPDRRYARDHTPGGPTREFKEMVRAFHDAGIKVYIDVVYNHTGEGGIFRDGRRDLPNTANILSWRGLDNPAYYELAGDVRFYFDNTGVGGNFNTAEKVVRDQILDSLRYWSKVLGVDGFRFDLAPVLGNAIRRNGFDYQKRPRDNPLNRAVNELPSRLVPAVDGPRVELIAEPWGTGPTSSATSPRDGPSGTAASATRSAGRRTSSESPRSAPVSWQAASQGHVTSSRTTGASPGIPSTSWWPMTASRSVTSTRSTISGTTSRSRSAPPTGTRTTTSPGTKAVTWPSSNRRPATAWPS